MKTKMEQIKALERIMRAYREKDMKGEPEYRSMERKTAKMIKSLPKQERDAYQREAEIRERDMRELIWL